ncbi:hypothetical protein BHM03_00022944 [Ensete ventricosum]|nr:hypothetical protein BHM03_00022944 [Ensete ventricosum]
MICYIFGRPLLFFSLPLRKSCEIWDYDWRNIVAAIYHCPCKGGQLRPAPYRGDRTRSSMLANKGDNRPRAVAPTRGDSRPEVDVADDGAQCCHLLKGDDGGL